MKVNKTTKIKLCFFLITVEIYLKKLVEYFIVDELVESASEKLSRNAGVIARQVEVTVGLPAVDFIGRNAHDGREHVEHKRRHEIQLAVYDS